MQEKKNRKTLQELTMRVYPKRMSFLSVILIRSD